LQLGERRDTQVDGTPNGATIGCCTIGIVATQFGGDGVDWGLLEAVLLPARGRRIRGDVGQRHLMWHEDVGVMSQFTVVNPDQVDSAPPTLEVDHDHMTAGHDHG
jgi:hypothetical protein